jgi:hypothetical protein
MFQHQKKIKPMKNRLAYCVLAVALAVLPGLLQAQPSAHYVPGVEGIKGASLPPPGIYFRDYNYFYTADQLNNASGGKNGPADLDTFTYANLPRVLWITDTKLLGGFVGLDGFLPFVYQRTSVNTPGGPFNGKTFGIGDFFAEGTLSWHLKQFDFAVGSGVDAPTGDSGPPPTTRIGAGYWTFMQTAGATWYIDEEKTWAVSALNRYEFNTKQRDTHVTPGDAYTLEWGVSKTVAKVVDLGAVGYYQQQVTGNSDRSPLNRVAAVGPEVNVVFPSQMLFVSLRYNYEFMAESRAQGHAFALTLTKRF